MLLIEVLGRHESSGPKLWVRAFIASAWESSFLPHPRTRYGWQCDPSSAVEPRPEREGGYADPLAHFFGLLTRTLRCFSGTTHRSMLAYASCRPRETAPYVHDGAPPSVPPTLSSLCSQVHMLMRCPPMIPRSSTVETTQRTGEPPHADHRRCPI